MPVFHPAIFCILWVVILISVNIVGIPQGFQEDVFFFLKKKKLHGSAKQGDFLPTGTMLLSGKIQFQFLQIKSNFLLAFTKTRLKITDSGSGAKTGLLQVLF